MSSEAKEWVLEPETEYRFELDPGTTVVIKLVRGHAEVFGAELVQGKTYLNGAECKAAVYTWQGCTLQIMDQHIFGHPSTDYISEETPMAAYANVHLALEQMRVRALAQVRGSPLPDLEPGDLTEPPRVLVLGPENGGKTTVCKILANYAVGANQGWAPVMVNVDPAAGAWTVPGTVSAATVGTTLGTSSSTSPLGASATSAPMHLTSNALLPLVYWYGHTAVQRNPRLLERIIRNMGEMVFDRWEYDTEGRASGLIVDTPAAFATAAKGVNGPDHRTQLVKACVDAFRINIILVVGHEKLNVEMQRSYGERCTVVKIPKSGGVVELDSAYRERIQTRQLHAYMYGEALSPPPGSGINTYLTGGEATVDVRLAPASSILPFGDLPIFRVGEESMAPTSALPIGATRAVSEMQPLPVDPARPGSGLRNGVLALLAPFAADETERYDEEVLDLPAVGFVAVTALDVPNRKMTVLAPGQSALAGKTAILGSLEWTEPA